MKGAMKIASILAPTDFGGSSGRSLDLAVDMAKQFDAKLTLVHCFEVPGYAYASLGAMPLDVLVAMEESARAGLDKVLREVKEK